MRFTVLGFNQQKAVEMGLTVNDLLLLQYIMQANGTPDMKHLTDDTEISYVWLNHAKISEDLPILNYTEGSLRNKLSELKQKGLIQSIKVPVASSGSKTYYSITTLTMSLINDIGCHAEVTSYNNNNNIKNNNTLSKDNVLRESLHDNDYLGTENEKPKKKNLYQKCLDMIYEFTNDGKLTELLIQYLNLLLEKSKNEGKPLYANQFKGMLNKLDEICTDGHYGEVVQQSIVKGYIGFFPVNNYSSKAQNYVPDTNKAPQHHAGEKVKNKDGTLKEY